MDVWAAHEGKVGHVLVRGDSPGVRIAETWDHIGTRATYSHDVLFTDVPIEAGHVVLRSPVEWVNADPAQMAWNAAGIGAIHTGIARAARDGILDFLRHRGATGANPLPGALTEIEMLLSANARLIASIATETDEGRPASPKESALVKAMVIENATRSVELAASLAADHAHARATAIDLHIRDARSGRGQAPQAAAAFAAGGRGALN
jgi:alkylation response protein AidB-like acyl-CoA dehydrogenase